MDDKLNRLRWKCRRGMLELDLILLKFVEEHYQTLTPTQQQMFDRLLDEQDPQLYEWFLGKGVPKDKELATIVGLINRLATKAR